MRAGAFPRSRRLKRRRLIRPLFERGRDDVGRAKAGTIVVLYRVVPRDATEGAPVQVGFAPGRRQTNARRTAVRRYLREAFRLHQAPLLATFADRPDALTLMALYRGRDDDASAAIRRDLPRALDRLVGRLADRPAPSDAPAS
ncbi:ribonuclease P protein component [Rubrivirga sp. IMCC45206]|uniref:ribonuclease P protein component n=1 Tax=Rubrivirga sp. IMCC45206 TaxID=3391614 RepID=UPI00398FCAC1